MKQSKWIRIMCLMLAVVMASSTYVCSTIARFSDVAQSTDSTRVAIWDINASEVTMDLFNTSYTDEVTGNTLAKSHNTENIIAPGTHGESLFSIVNHKGDIAPEVMYYIQIDLDDSQVSDDIITNSNIQWKLDNGNWGTWDQLKIDLYSLSGSPSGIKTYQAGQLADAFKKDVTHKISWQWLKEDIDTNTMSDEEDYTALISVKVTARQTSTIYTNAVEGSNNVVNVAEEIEPLVVKSSAPLNEFQEVLVNDEVVDDDNYTLTEGSTIVTFKPEYLESLPIGGYTVSIVSKNQVATAKLDFVDRVYTTPGTGDNTDSEISDEPEINEPIVHNGIIPEGGTYYKNLNLSPFYFNFNIGDYADTIVYVEGDEFPEPQHGDAYVYGDYEYRYGCVNTGNGFFKVNDFYGWSVAVFDKNKSSYDELIDTINGKELLNVENLFFEAKNLVTAPVIPETVTMMNYVFWGCVNLTGNVKINANPEYYDYALSDTEKPIILIGSSTDLYAIASTANNGNVTVGIDLDMPTNDTLIHNSVIPLGGTYYKGINSIDGPNGPEDRVYVTGDYGTADIIFRVGDEFPEPQTGDVYIYGDYEYRYNTELEAHGYEVWRENENLNGWGVKVRDISKTKYNKMLSVINNKNIVSLSYTFFDCINLVETPQILNNIINMSGTFYNCTSLVEVPVIPNSVKELDFAFFNCKSLIEAPVIPEGIENLEFIFYGCEMLKIAPVIPNSVIDMSNAFANCTSLIIAPVIPESVIDMGGTFYNCTSLITAPVIPENVIEIGGDYTDPSDIYYVYGTFQGCINLTGTVEINANPRYYGRLFYGTEKPIKLTGSSTMLDEIADEFRNVTVAK